MLRSPLLACCALTACVGCGPSTLLEVSPPLVVVDSFPSNGATLPGSEVTHIDLVFSEILDGTAALSAIKLASVNDSDEVDTAFALVADEDKGPAGFDEARRTLSLTIGTPSTDGTLPDGAHFRIRIEQGLSARNGSVLPVEVVRRFATRSN
ncbi:MAG: hypothetical protein ABIJ09_19210 [Pseudomonadota bacterium]